MFTRLALSHTASNVQTPKDLFALLKNVPGFRQLGKTFEVSKTAKPQVVSIMESGGLKEAPEKSMTFKTMYTNGRVTVVDLGVADNPNSWSYGISK